MKKLIISFALALGITAFAAAQTTDVSGTIRTTDGTPIAGVVVTDGHTVVATDAEGKYAFNRHEEAAYVYYSIPAEYRVPLRQGHPCFYKKLTDDKVYDFVLQPLKGGKESNFRLVMVADPQCQNLRHVYRFHSETAPDLKKTAKKTKTPIYAVSLGDIVYSEGPRNANYLMPMIKEEMRAENIGMPMFQTIGNHDCDYEPVAIGARNSTPTVRLQRMFEATFGPIDYSWNRGDVHIVSMNDIIYDDINNFKKYHGDFTAEQVEWLRKDLSYVSKDKMVILCVHIPLENMRKSKNVQAVLAMLSEFAESLSLADEVLICDIYAAREENIYGVTPEKLAELIDGARAVHGFDEPAEILKRELRNGDVAIIMGAGDVWKVFERLDLK